MEQKNDGDDGDSIMNVPRNCTLLFNIFLNVHIVIFI